MKQSPKESLRQKVLIRTILILLAVSATVAFAGYKMVSAVIHEQIKSELKRESELFLSVYEEKVPGKFTVALLEDGTVQLSKGEKVISDDYTFIDPYTKNLGLELSIFYKDIRLLTTIKDENGNRRVDTHAFPVVVKEVIASGKDAFYPSVELDEETYHAYYTPIFEEDGSVFGMLGVARVASNVFTDTWKTVLPIILLCILGIAVMGISNMEFSRQTIEKLGKVAVFMKAVADGNFSAGIDDKLLHQKDELGELARTGQKMQKSLRKLVEFDTLTDLHNRWYANTRLVQSRDRFEKSGLPYCVSISDIDFFKKVNDTYGHEMGDEVLKQVAHTLKKHMVGKGFVARWGGEEFLMVFDMESWSNVKNTLEETLDEIRAIRIPCGEEEIRVTMSFGVVMAEEGEAIDSVLKRADELLYYGKTHGRNQVASESHEEGKK